MLEGTPGGQFRPTLAQNRANVQVRSCCTELCSGVLKSSKNLYATFFGQPVLVFIHSHAEGPVIMKLLVV